MNLYCLLLFNNLIQSLRNTIFVGTFIGGYAITFAYSFMNSIDTSNFYDFNTPLFAKDTRSLIIAVLLFCSFINWAMVLKYASEVGYLIDSSSEANRVAVSDGHVENDANSRSSRIGEMANRMVMLMLLSHYCILFSHYCALISLLFVYV
jgi:hypothetical protein